MTEPDSKSISLNDLPSFSNTAKKRRAPESLSEEFLPKHEVPLLSVTTDFEFPEVHVRVHIRVHVRFCSASESGPSADTKLFRSFSFGHRICFSHGVNAIRNTENASM